VGNETNLFYAFYSAFLTALNFFPENEFQRLFLLVVNVLHLWMYLQSCTPKIKLLPQGCQK